MDKREKMTCDGCDTVGCEFCDFEREALLTTQKQVEKSEKYDREHNLNGY